VESVGQGKRLGALTMQKAKVWTFSFTHLTNDLVTTGIVPALLPMYRDAFSLNYTQTGLIVLFSYITSSVMQPLFGAWTDKKPKVWMLPIGVFLSVLGLALTGIAPSYGWVLFFIALSGLGSGAFHPEASRGTHYASGNAKGLAQAIFQVGGNAGQALGPLMIPLFLVSTGRVGLLWFAIIGLIAFLLAARVVPWYRERLEDFGRNKRQLTGKNHWWGVFLLVCVIILRSWCQIGVSAFLPFFFLHQMHMSYGHAELLNFLFLGAGALGTFFGGAISDKIGMKRLLVGSMLFSIPFALLLPYAKGGYAWIILLLFGFFVLSSFAVTVVYMQRLLPRNIAMASGLAIGFGVGAGGIGATLMGYLTDLYGIMTIMSAISVLPIAASLLAFLLPSDRKVV
jgi:FSR family fosmidomycin resistance protein-like MFS transporter